MRLAALALCVLIPAFSLTASAQDVLPRVGDDNLLYVPIDGRPDFGLVIVEINGIRQTQPARVVGSSYVVDIPTDLRGNRHDLRLFIEGARAPREIGWWIFETSNPRSLVFGSLLSEVGVHSTDDGVRGFADGVLRLEFNRNDGQQSGRLVLSRSDRYADPDADEISIDDLFLETRFPLFGQDGFARIGNANLGVDTLLQDTASRRGLTFGLLHPSGERTLTAFVLTPDIEPGLDNVLGLSDRDDLVYGVSGSFAPYRLNGFRFNVTSHEGRTRSLPDGGTGDISGSALSIETPIAGRRGDLSFGLASSDWRSDGASAVVSASAWEAKTAWRLSDVTAYQQYEVSLKLEQVEQGFYAPFNPLLIFGEERVSLTISSFSPTWQSALTFKMAKTNYKGPVSAPTDRLSSVAFSLFHDPGDFTGGFLNGTTFYLNAGIDWQDRLITPSGAAPAKDNRLVRLSFGMNRVQPNVFWGARIAYDDLQFDASSASDERKLFAEARLDVSPSPLFSAQFFGRAGLRETGGVQFKEAEASLALVRKSANGLWETALAGSFIRSDDPGNEDGKSATLSLARDVGAHSQLVGEIEWGSGRYAPRGVANEGVSVGVFLRTDFGFSRN